MNNYRSLNHTKWECQYHVVFIPNVAQTVWRLAALLGGRAAAFGEQRESLEEGLLADRPMLVSIPPRASGISRGRVRSSREFAGRPRNVGQHFWARGYYVSIGRRVVPSSSRNAKTGGSGWRSSHL